MQAPSRVTISLYIMAVMLLMACIFLAKGIVDLDLWGVMSMGALLDQNPNQFPYTDVFSYTNFGKPWVYHEWGAGVIFYQLLKHFGSASLLFLKWVLFCSTVWIAYITACQQTPAKQLAGFHRWWLVGLPIAIFLLLPAYMPTIRCHTFSLLLFAIFLNRLASQRHLWLLPFLMAVWVNLHGGFVMGLFLLGFYLVWAIWERRWQDARRLGLTTLLTCFALFLNPYGADLLSELIEAWQMNREQITEWQNVLQGPGPHGIVYSAFLVLILILAARKAVKRWQGWSSFPGVVLLLIATGTKGFLHAKLSPFFVLSTMSVGVPWLMPDKTDTTLRPLPWAGFVFGKMIPLCLVGFGATAFYLLLDHPLSTAAIVPDLNHREGKVEISYPVSATDFLRNKGIQGNLWSRFEWGEYLYWTLTPQIKIACDGRYETTYTGPACEDVLRFYQAKTPQGQHALATLAHYPQTTLVMIPKRLRFLRDQFESAPNWQLIYTDPGILLYQKLQNPSPLTHGAVLKTKRTLDASVGNLSRFQKRL